MGKRITQKEAEKMIESVPRRGYQIILLTGSIIRRDILGQLWLGFDPECPS